jgi:hypothetical protein
MPRLKPQESPDKRPIASWASGKEIAGSDRTHKGWVIDQALDTALDVAAHDAGWSSGELEHLDGEVRQHWLLPNPCHLFVLIQGVPYTKMTALVKSDVSFAGVGARWPQGGRSALAVQCLHPDLLAQGYGEPIVFSVSSTRTDDLLAALLAHNAVLEHCEELAAANGKPRTFEFWEVAVPLTFGQKVVRGQGQLTSSVYPIVAAHPNPDQLDAAYLRTLLAPKSVADVVNDRWAQITAWATDFARGNARQTDGDDGAEEPTGRGERSPQAARMSRYTQ